MKLFRRRSTRDFAEEIEAHLEIEAERLRDEGFSEAEARSGAARAFGNVTAASERFYERGRSAWIDSVARDMQQAVRGLRRRPGFALAAIVTLALGIGVNTAIFSAVDETLFRPPDLPDAGRLANVYRFDRKASRYLSASYPDFDDFRRGARSFEQLAAYARLQLPVDWGAGTAERIAVEAVSGNYFGTLRAAPLRGRALTPADDLPGAPPVAVISDATWRSRFHSSPAAVGAVVRIGDVRFTIVGVAPDAVTRLNLNWLTPPRIWVPLRTAALVVPRMAEAKIFENRLAIWLVIVGRLQPGATAASARSELDALSTRIDSPSAEMSITAAVLPLNRSKFWPSYRKDVANSLAAFSIAAALILLLASANVSNLLLERAVGRRREMAARLALGAHRGWLVRQLLIESAVLTAMSCAAGTATAVVFMRLLGRFPAALGLPLSLDLKLEPRALVFCAIVSAAVIVLCGLAPALWTAKLDLASAFRAGGSGAGPKEGRLRAALVVLQAAVSMMLLVGGGLYGRTLWNAYSTDLGFRSADLLTAGFSLPPPGASTADRYWAAQRRMLDELSAVPGVVSATISSTGILSAVRPNARVRRSAADATGVTAGCEFVARDYLRTAGIALLAGRDFTGRDEVGTEPVAIVNAALSKLLGDGGTIGATIWIEAPGRGRRAVRVIGVAADARYRSVWDAPEAHVYLAAGGADTAAGFLLVRTAGPTERVAAALRPLWAGLDRSAPLYDLRTGADAVALSLEPQRVAAAILGGFAAIGLALTAVGLYSVIAVAVTRQTREIGIRMAIGAAPGDVIAGIVGRAMRWLGAGMALGAAGSLVAGRFLAANARGVGPYDAPTYAFALAVLALAGATAAIVPALRAAHTDPSAALRSE